MKNYSEIAKEVIELMATSLGANASAITEESIIADLSRDSIQLFELLLAFEKAYEVETAYEDVVKMHTVRDVIEYVSRIKYGIVE